MMTQQRLQLAWSDQGLLFPPSRRPLVSRCIGKSWAQRSRQVLPCIQRSRGLGLVLRPVAAAATADASFPGEGASQTPSRWPLSRVKQAWQQWWDLGSDSATAEKLPPPQELSSILAKFGELLRPEGGRLAVASLFMVLAALSELAIPHFISASVFAATKATSRDLFHRNLLLLTAATGGYSVFAGLRGYIFSIINTNLLQRLRQQLFSRLMQQEVSFFDAQDAGQLTSRLGADCSVIARLFATNINVALRNTLQCLGGGIYLWMLSPRMALACAGVSAVLWGVALYYGSFTRRAQRIYQDALAESNSAAEESFSLSRLIRAFGTEGIAAARYGATLASLRHISIRQAVAYASYVTTNHWFYNFTRIATLLVGGASALAGHITAEQLTTFVLYVEFVTSAMLSVCDQWGPISEAVGASERVISYLDGPIAPQLSSGILPPGGVQGRLDIDRVTFSYPSRPDVLALDDVSLTLPAGQLVALVGLSGSGKSTLVALVQRLYDPCSGAVRLDGVDLRELDAAWFRSQIGVVSQDPRLFGLTVAGNIAYGCPEASRAQVEEAAKLANAHDFISALPQGYDTPVTDKLLSGGQRQRIAIARALVRNPRILILDEATSALDAESEAAVQAALDRAMRSHGRTVLVIAHRLSTVRHADLTVVMHSGKVAEVGTHSELIARGGIYAALVRRQSGKMLEQDRDLAPHEAAAAASGGGSSGAAGGGGPSGSGDGEAGVPGEGVFVAAGSAAPAPPRTDQLPQLRGSSRPAGIAARNSDEPQ